MEHYAFGGVLGLMACTFGWAASCDWHRWRRPWWGWLCGVSGLLALGAFAGTTWARGDVPGYAWWLVLALALAGCLISFVHMNIRGVAFTSTDIETVSAFRRKCDASKPPLNANALLGDLDILCDLARCPESATWARRFLKKAIAEAQERLNEMKKVLEEPLPSPKSNRPTDPDEGAPPDTPDVG